MFVEFRTRLIVMITPIIFLSCAKDIKPEPLPDSDAPHLEAIVDNDTISFPTNMYATVQKGTTWTSLKITGRTSKTKLTLVAYSLVDDFLEGKTVTQQADGDAPPNNITLVVDTETDSIPFSTYYEPMPGYVPERMEIIITERTEEYIEGIFCGDLYEETYPYFHKKVLSNGNFKAQF